MGLEVYLPLFAQTLKLCNQNTIALRVFVAPLTGFVCVNHCGNLVEDTLSKLASKGEYEMQEEVNPVSLMCADLLST